MAIFDFHHPLIFTFGVLGNIVSICVYLSPVPTFIEICRRKSTLGFQPLPYVAALLSSMLWMYYAILKTNSILLISINLFGCMAETVYLALYLAFASRQARKHTAKLLASMNVGLFGAVFLLTLFLFNGSHRVAVVGWACVAVSVSVFAAPMSILFQVVRSRSVEFMPFPLSFFLTLSAVLWFGYGLVQRDLCVALPNIIGFFLGMIQMLMYAIYRNARKVIIVEELEKKTMSSEHVIDIAMQGASEVHPVGSQTSSSGRSDEISVETEEDEDDDREKEDRESEQKDDHKKHERSAVASVPHQLDHHEPGRLDNVLQQQLDSPTVIVVCAAA